MDLNSHILIVDDEFLVLLDLHTQLQQRGFSNISTASNVAGAMTIVENETIVMAFLDINLGNETSYDIASALQERNIPFAFVSGYAKDFVDAAFDDVPVITKPVSSGDIDQFLRRG
ncbi:response regulator [Pelagibacterium lacus]|uniref:response regulator n=1 Tax=Pelagibacterium lacus TaxID=2282655 RepID=UPI001313DDDE|nr:response regulator [Pelagibacterium lacus]